MTSPAQTIASLLASATTAPRSMAASVEGNPAAPVMAAMVQSAGRLAAAATAASPHAVAMPLPASSRANSACCPASEITACSAPSASACSASNAALRPPTSATTR